MAANYLNALELEGMIRHWLTTPPNGYLGSGYGSDPHSMLQTPMKTGLADQFLDKMKRDLPIIGALPAGTVNVFLREVASRNDAKQVIIDVLGKQIDLGEVDLDRIAR